MKPTAVAIAGYNRPHYFRPTILSLLANQHIKSCHLWCFFDGGPSSCQAEYRQILRDEASTAPYHPCQVYFVDRSDNWGCERNLIDLRRRLFEREGYDRVFVFEDDLVLSPHYLTLTERLLDWAEANFSDVGAVQAYSPCLMPKAEKNHKLDEVEVGNPHWWGYLMPKGTWNAVRDTLYEYEDRFLSGGDRRIIHDDVRHWAVAKLRRRLASVDCRSDVLRGSRRFPFCWDFENYFAGTFATGQDSMTVLAMTLAGLQKLATSVNRARPIGASGLHSTPEFFSQAGLDRIELHNFPSDAARHSFRVRPPAELSTGRQGQSF